MKRLMQLAAVCLMLSGCGNTKKIDGVTYDVYGIANQTNKQNPSIRYELSPGSVIVAIIFCETIIIPAYVVLFDLYEPVGSINGSPVKGAID